MRALRPLLALVFLICSPLQALAQDYPSKPVRIIVPAPAGSPIDVLARIIGQKLTEMSGQQFIVDNRPGATGTTGTTAAVKATPDGYTLLMSSTSNYISAYYFNANVSYNPGKDLEAIILVAKLPAYLLANPKFPAKSISELIALSRQNPDKHTFASMGHGSGPHLIFEMFMKANGIRLLHIPYKGQAPALNGLVAGQVDVAFDNVLTSHSLVKAGLLKALAVTGTERVAVTPDVATMAESGMRGFELYFWFGLLAPTGTPSFVIEKLNGEIGRIMSTPEMQERLAQLGGNHTPNSPHQFRDFLASDTARWVKLIEDTGARLD